MSEIVGAFLWSEFRDEGADAAPETANGSFGGLAQESFELGKCQFDWVEVGRVLRQVEKRRARGLDGFTHPGGKMGLETVHDDDIAALERRHQALFNIGKEHFSGYRPLDHHRRHHCIMTQAGHKRDGLPMALRHVAD